MPSNYQKAILCLFFGHFHSLDSEGLHLVFERTSPRDWVLTTKNKAQTTRKKNKKKERGTKKGQGSQGNEDMGEAGAKGPFNATCSFNYACYSPCCCCFFTFMWVFYVFVGPLHATHPQGQQSRQRFCYFFSSSWPPISCGHCSPNPIEAAVHRDTAERRRMGCL